MGYLSQIVQDARPRAAPSLYVSAPAVPSVAGEAPTYARLMDGSAAQQPSAQSKAPDQPVRNTLAPADQDEVTPGAQHGSRAPRTARPTGDVAVSNPAQTIVPDVRPPATEATRHALSATNARPVLRAQPGLDQANVEASATTPRPALYDVPVRNSGDTAPPADIASKERIGIAPGSAPQTGPNTGSEERAGSVPDSALQTRPNPALATDKQAIAPRISVQRIDRNDPFGRDFVPPLEAEQWPHVSAASPVFLPTERTSIAQSGASSGPIEVRIGEVEIVVQESPAPRPPISQRSAPAAPSPARFHIRRL